MSAPRIGIHLRDTARWYITGTVSARGAAYVHGELRNAHQLAELLGHSSVEDLANPLQKLNGFFAVICRLPDGGMVAAVDKARSIALYYGQAHGRLFVSDDAYWVRDRVGDNAFASDAAIEFALTGYVTGADTLSPHVKQLQAGEMIYASATAHGLSVEQQHYFRYKHVQREDPGLESLVADLGGICEAAIKRLVSFAKGRQIVLPLTGGLDSGRIALLLKAHGFDNILAYSYGRDGNQDSLDGASFARKLRIPWEFVPYTKARWQQWFSLPQRREYYRFADGLSSLAILQEWPAVFELKQRGVLSADAIFVPGYTAEGFIRPLDNPPDWPPFFDDRIDVHGVVQAIFELHYTLLDWTAAQATLAPMLRARILAAVGDPAYFGSSTGVYENWCLSERQAKFITNAVRAYEFWGYDWWLPLWDGALIDFWSQVPVPYRIGRHLTSVYFQQLCRQVLGDVALPKRVSKLGMVTRAVASRIRRWGESFPPLAGLYAKARQDLHYATHPLAWYEMVPRHAFDQLFRGKANINTFLALERLGLLSFADAAQRPVEMPWERTGSLAQHRS